VLKVTARRAFAVLIVSQLLAACGPGDVGNIGSGSIGVRLRNDCSVPILAGAADSPEKVRAEVSANADRIEPGKVIGVRIVTFAGYSPERYFIGVGPDVDHLTITEFDIKVLKAKFVRTSFGADCSTLNTGA
jgi:hypothetical protein